MSDRDQIGVGKTILMFRSGEEAKEERAPARRERREAGVVGVLFACFSVSRSGGQFGERSKQASPEPDYPSRVGSDPGRCRVSRSRAQPCKRYRPIRKLNGLGAGELGKAGLARIAEEGAFEDSQTGMIGVPLYLANVLGGALLLQTKASERERLPAHLETLTAIASLASIGFEANREVENLKVEKALLEERIGVPNGIVGNSPPIRRLLTLIDRVAPRDSTVLITGESGTGKELIARALHQGSDRRDHHFIAVNCAALSENLFESELFGHEKGAFTGAIALKKGRFELAEGGTIFLDEVGELALPLQAKLLRVLQQREFERVGGTQVHSLDIRVIAATNRDLQEDVREGKFREDLLYRLNVVTLESPPLRDRKEDIPILARYFLESSAKRCKRQVEGVSKEAEEILMQYSWPGNVRELENAMERAVVLGVSDAVLPEDLPEAMLESAPRESGAKYHSSLGQAKREAILDAYVQGGGDYKQAARLLGLHPNYLLRLVRNLNLRDEINRRLGE